MFFHSHRERKSSRHPERKSTVGEETQKLFFFLPGVFCLAIPVTTATSSLEKITHTHTWERKSRWAQIHWKELQLEKNRRTEEAEVFFLWCLSVSQSPKKIDHAIFWSCKSDWLGLLTFSCDCGNHWRQWCHCLQCK